MDAKLEELKKELILFCRFSQLAGTEQLFKDIQSGNEIFFAAMFLSKIEEAKNFNNDDFCDRLRKVMGKLPGNY